MIELNNWMLASLLAIAVVNTTLSIACYHWHVHYASNAKLLAKLRDQIPKNEQSKVPATSLLRYFWDRTCILAFFAIPACLAVAHYFYRLPVAPGTLAIFALWLLTPFGELCGIVNRCELQGLRILNSKLELLRRRYVNKTRTN